MLARHYCTAMSTKSTIAHGPTFHLYNDLGDERYVYLELESVPSDR